MAPTSMNFAQATSGKLKPVGCNVRTVRVNATDNKKNSFKDVMKEMKECGWSDFVKKVTPLATGRFSMTLQMVEQKEEVLGGWEDALALGKMTFQLERQIPTLENHRLVITGTPEEMPLLLIEGYMAKYVLHPKASSQKYEDDEFGYVETGNITVDHQGLRGCLPRVLDMGQGVKAQVIGSTQIPWEKVRLKCNSCLEFGHTHHQCLKDVLCHRCKATGHKFWECAKCEECSKWGHQKDKRPKAEEKSQIGKTSDHSNGTKSKNQTASIDEVIKEVREKVEEEQKTTATLLNHPNSAPPNDDAPKDDEISDQEADTEITDMDTTVVMDQKRTKIRKTQELRGG